MLGGINCWLALICFLICSQELADGFSINLVRNILHDNHTSDGKYDFMGRKLEQPSMKIFGKKYQQIVNSNSSLLALNKVLEHIMFQWEKQGLEQLNSLQFDSAQHTMIINEYCSALEAKNLGFIGSMTPDYANLVESMSQTFNIPFLTWDSNFNEELPQSNTFSDRWSSLYDKQKPKCRLFSMRPDLIQPLVEYLLKWKWTRFAYLYASDEAFHRMESVKFSLFQSISAKPDHIHPIVTDRIESKSTHDDGTNIEIESGFIDLTNPNSVHDTLKAIDEYLKVTDQRQVVIDLGGDTIGSQHNNYYRLIKLFSWLTHMGMIRKEYHYLLIDFHILDLPLGPFKNSKVNISGFHIINYELQNVKSFIQQWSNVNLDFHSVAFIEEAFEVMSHINTNLAIMKRRFQGMDSSPTCYDDDGTYRNQSTVSQWTFGDLISDFLVKSEITGKITGTIRFDPLTCKRTGHELILADFSGERGAQTTARWISELSWFKPRQHVDAGPDKGVYEFENSDEHKETKSLIQRIQEENRIIRVVTVKEEPFVMHRPNAPKTATKGKENFHGYCVDLAEKIFTLLNISYDIHLVKDGKYGAYNEHTKKWNGMVGELVRDEADVAIAPLTMSSIRAEDVIFTEPFMNLGLSVIMRKPGKTKPGTFSFLSPLKSEVWLLIIIASLVVSTALKIISLISPYEKVRPDNSSGFTVSNSLWFSLASFVHQGIDLFPISPGARILAAVWRIFCLLMMAYYTANLAAALSFERLISPINSIRDLVDKNNHGIAVGSLDSGATKNFFATTNDTIYRAVHEKMSENPSWYSKTVEIALERVRKGSYAFILESKMNEYVNQRKPCNTMMIGEVFGSKDYAVAVPRNQKDAQALRDHITDIILRLRENQVLAKMYTEWWLEKGECADGGEGSKSEPLALVNLSGAFYILVTGLVLAMITGMSLLLHRLNNQKSLMKKKTKSPIEVSQPDSLVQSVHITEF